MTSAEAAAIVKVEARVLPPPLSTAVAVDRGGGGMEPMALMGVSLTAVAVDGSGSNGAVAATVDDNN